MSLANRIFGSDPDAINPDDIAVQLDVDDVFETLLNERRRMLLMYVHENDMGDGVSISDAARAVAGQVFDTPVEQVSSTDYKKIYVGFYQCHVPNLAEIGLIRTERQHRLFATQRTAEVLAFLDVTETMIVGEPGGEDDERDE